jgi:hypothetical protein
MEENSEQSMERIAMKAMTCHTQRGKQEFASKVITKEEVSVK